MFACKTNMSQKKCADYILWSMVTFCKTLRQLKFPNFESCLLWKQKKQKTKTGSLVQGLILDWVTSHFLYVFFFIKHGH